MGNEPKTMPDSDRVYGPNSRTFTANCRKMETRELQDDVEAAKQQQYLSPFLDFSQSASPFAQEQIQYQKQFKTPSGTDIVYALDFVTSSTGLSSAENFKLTLLTQCLSSVGVLYPSPLNTWPKWPPQFEQTISVRSIPNVRSVCRVTAPGMLSKYAGHPHPDLNLCFAV